MLIGFHGYQHTGDMGHVTSTNDQQVEARGGRLQVPAQGDTTRGERIVQSCVGSFKYSTLSGLQSSSKG